MESMGIYGAAEQNKKKKMKIMINQTCHSAQTATYSVQIKK